ncbi:MAG: hypothetical protein ACKVPJ_13400 [Chitinophagales bacterium]
MDRIIVNGRDLVLDDNWYLPLMSENPVFIDNGIPGLWSLPATIPNDDAGINASILGYPHQPDVIIINKRKFNDVKIILGNGLQFLTQLSVLRGSENGFEITIKTDLFPDIPGFTDKSLKEIYDEEIDIINPPDVFFLVTVDFGASPAPDLTYQLWFDGEFFEYTSSGGELAFAIISSIIVDMEASGLSVDIDTTVGAVFELTITQHTPAPDVFLDISNVLSFSSGFTSVSIDWTTWIKEMHDDLHEEITTISENDYSYAPYTFFPVKNDRLYDTGINDDYIGYMNCYNCAIAVERFEFNFRTGVDYEGHKYPYVPFIYFKKLWEIIFTDNGITTKGDILDAVGFSQMTIYNTFTLDRKLVAPETSGEPDMYYISCSFNTKDHLPDMTVAEFLDGFKELFNLYFTYDVTTKTLTVRQREPIPEEKALKDWREKKFLSKPILEYVYNYGVTLNSEQDTDDEITDHYYKQHDAYIYEEGVLEKKCIFSWPQMLGEIAAFTKLHPADEYANWKVPHVKQLGSSKAYETYNPFSPRLLFYRGYQEVIGEDSQLYPYASNDDLGVGETIDMEDTTPVFNLTFIWERMFSNYYKNWLRFTNAYVIVRCEFVLDENEIQLFLENPETLYSFRSIKGILKSYRITGKFQSFFAVEVELLGAIIVL